MLTLTDTCKLMTDWNAWNDAGRPCVFWGKHSRLQSMRAYLLGVDSSHICSAITSEARKLYGGRINGMNTKRRECLRKAIFNEMDRIESKNGGQSDHPIVMQLNIAMNLVLDDLGEND